MPFQFAKKMLAFRFRYLRMMKLNFKANSRIYLILLGILALAGLYTTHFFSFLLFHSISEMIGIGIAWGIFMLAWNLRHLPGNYSFIFAGIAFLFTGALDLVHTLAYKGMNVFPGNDADMATQLWIGARYLQAVSLLTMPFLESRKVNFRWVFALFAFVFVILLLSIVYWHVFPECYVEGRGLTSFKIYSEYIISFILAASAFFLYRKKSSYDSEVLRLLLLSIGLLIVSELAFTYYIEVYDLSNAVAHLVKIAAYFLLYKAIIETGLKKPFNFLLRDIKQKELELLKTVEELERSNKELEQFAYIASHDLQEPVRMVGNYTQLLERRYKDKLDPQALEFIHFAADGAHRMRMLITGLLEYSRITSHTRNYSPVDCSKVLESVIKNLDMSIRETGARIVSDPLPIIMGDEVQLIQLFQNLISNAIKFRRQAEIPEIRLSAVQRSGEWLFSVKDNGIGIDPQQGERIFQIFQRLHDRDEYPGTGIGLAVCKRIVERHKGKIWIESGLSEGTTFYFTFSNN
ncbi:MAG: sensor histidine kinase [archaeon]